MLEKYDIDIKKKKKYETIFVLNITTNYLYRTISYIYILF